MRPKEQRNEKNKIKHVQIFKDRQYDNIVRSGYKPKIKPWNGLADSPYGTKKP